MGTITLNKNSSATILEIRNFENEAMRVSMPVEVIEEIESDEEATKLFKIRGNVGTISFEWILTDEATSVVTGTGSPVTTAVGQKKYLFDTLQPTGIADTFTLTIDYGGGVTIVRTGTIVDIATIMTKTEPITFRGTITFQIGTTL